MNISQKSPFNSWVVIITAIAINLLFWYYTNRLQQDNQKLEKTLDKLQPTQQKLIQKEKQAALGQLIAGIAHEINNPLGAIQASADNNNQALVYAIAHLPKLDEYLNSNERDVFFNLLDCSLMGKSQLSSSEKRSFKRQIIARLQDYKINNKRRIADLLVDLGIYNDLDFYLVLLKHPQVDLILNLAYNITRLLNNNRTIISSVERASRVVFSLNNFTIDHQDKAKQLVEITEGIDRALNIYYPRLKIIDIWQNYQTKAKIWCYPDELIQVWSNLIYNAIQELKVAGKLTISAITENEGIKVEIQDNGSGISPDIQDKIFNPFFTTKPPGEGSGLGLHISKKIIERHQGNITVSSQPGETIFTVWLPLGIEH